MIAWVACASIGIMMARYYKEVWPNSTLCSQKVWFTVSEKKYTFWNLVLFEVYICFWYEQYNLK